MMRRSPALLATTALAVAWLVSAAPAVAQTGQDQDQGQTQTMPLSQITDEKLDKVAAAIQHVTTVKETYQQKIQSAAPSDRRRLAGEAADALGKAVTDQGISLEEYSAILEVARNDNDVRNKILKRITPSAPGSSED